MDRLDKVWIAAIGFLGGLTVAAWGQERQWLIWSQEAAGWVQAIGTIVAIIGSAQISLRISNQDAARGRAQLKAQQLDAELAETRRARAHVQGTINYLSDVLMRAQVLADCSKPVDIGLVKLQGCIDHLQHVSASISGHTEVFALLSVRNSIDALARVGKLMLDGPKPKREGVQLVVGDVTAQQMKAMEWLNNRESELKKQASQA